MTIEELREKEQRALDKFYCCCQALLDTEAELQDLHNQLDAQGEQSKQPFEKGVLIAEAKNIIKREQYRQRKIYEAAHPVKRVATGRTYSLKNVRRRKTRFGF